MTTRFHAMKPGYFLRTFLLPFVILIIGTDGATAQTYDIVVRGGRVMDPETGFDKIANVGISGQTILAITESDLKGRKVIDARGLVVAPGFIDLHAHGQTNLENSLQVQDGVTTALELEIGKYPVDHFYDVREGKALINYGHSVSHIWGRADALYPDEHMLENPGPILVRAAHHSAEEDDRQNILSSMESSLAQGAIGIGFGIEYTPAVGREEVYRIFQLAAKHGAPVFVHPRRGREGDPASGSNLQQMQEVIANAAATGVGLHICHLPSSAIQDTAITLELIDEARAHGVDVTTEAYPYTAGSTILISALFDAGWRERLGGVDYSDVVWTATGERLTEKTFHAYRKHAMETDDPANVIIHFVPEDAMRMAINHPDVIIASDGMTIRNNNEHPRGTGTYARVLGRFVREEGAMSMMAALRKMTILPAQRLESYAPAMRNKGRVKVGADADLTLIDPKRVIDRATYKDPMVPSDGFPYVLVNGVVVVENGTLQEGVFPGKAIKGKGLAVLAQ